MTSVVERMHEDDMVRFDEASLRHYHTMLLLPPLPAGSDVAPRRELAEQAGETVQSILNSLQPWNTTTIAAERQKTADGLAALYRREIGDPRDPVFRAKMEQDIAAQRELRRQEREAAADTDEMRIARRLAERDQRLKRNHR